jgi:hypothetical protein
VRNGFRAIVVRSPLTGWERTCRVGPLPEVGTPVPALAHALGNRNHLRWPATIWIGSQVGREGAGWSEDLVAKLGGDRGEQLEVDLGVGPGQMRGRGRPSDQLGEPGR